VSRYPEPRAVVVTLADLRRTTVLERARACAIAGVGETELARLVDSVIRHEGSPEDIARGSTVFYALALQLEIRLDRSWTWEQAQTWDVKLDLSAADPVADAEAKASVDAALATGLPPAVAGELTLAQLDAYREHAADIDKRAKRRRRKAS
jgi:hypothetical protein